VIFFTDGGWPPPMSRLEYAAWMREVDARLNRTQFDPVKCAQCGGTGVDAVMCCGGQECGCRGLPIDFVPCQRGCVLPPWWETL